MANIAGAATEITASCVDQVPVRGGFVFTGQSNKLFIQISYLPSRSTSLSPPSNPSSPIPVSDRFAAALNNAVTDPATSNAAQSVQGEGQDGLERSASAETIDYGNGYQTENYCNFDTGTGCRWGFSCVQQPALKNTGVMFGPTDFTASVCLTDVVGF
ncbi:MAG: hypothetical protein M1827_006887 [Pycnora praestabilis]|nr:MAG: hypothetical protein M1827_006887 [Pycnora praestabilis]